MSANLLLNLKLVLIIFSVLLSTSLQGCSTKLQQIEEFSKSTVAASHSFGIVSDDIPKSCYRRVNFEFRRAGLRDFVTISKTYEEFTNTCQRLSKSLNGINNANGILKGYAESLGKLAAEDVAKFSTELANIETNLKNVEIQKGVKPFEKDERFKAIAGLANFLFSIFGKAYQREMIIETIEAANKDEAIYKLTDGLKDVIGDYAIGDTSLLALEKQAIESVKKQYEQDIQLLTSLIVKTDTEVDSQRVKLCTRAINDIENTPYKEFCHDLKVPVDRLSQTPEGVKLIRMGRPSLEDLVRYKSDVSKLYEERETKMDILPKTIVNIDEINQKQQSSSKAIETLDTISTTHRKLYNNRRSIDAQALLDAIKELSGQVESLSNQIKDAF